jgi:hypothetical protein
VTDWKEGQPLEEDLRVALCVIADSPDDPRRVRIFNAAGEERARLSGVLAWEEGEGWVRLVVDEGGGLTASLTIPLDSDTYCTIEQDGTMNGILPSGSTWTTTPLWAEDEAPP